jgi:tRNA-splicing ligase RtcB (3'-phosphate/5'-hydroxy nucleic acid ligase)
MGIQITLNKGRVPVKIWTDDVEHEAIQQLVNVSQLPIVHGHIAAMPDVHAGVGATVGSVIATKAAIIPAAVGVDIGCGMNAVRLSIKAADLPDNLYRVRPAKCVARNMRALRGCWISAWTTSLKNIRR